jgi:hypothetical protein
MPLTVSLSGGTQGQSVPFKFGSKRASIGFLCRPKAALLFGTMSRNFPFGQLLTDGNGVMADDAV